MYSKIENLFKNRKLVQKSKICSKIENFFKNRKNFQKSKLCSKVDQMPKIFFKFYNFFSSSFPSDVYCSNKLYQELWEKAKNRLYPTQPNKIKDLEKKYIFQKF